MKNKSNLLNKGPATFFASFGLDWTDLEMASIKRKYHIFKLPKKNGTFRTIEAPSARMKAMQYGIKRVLDWEYMKVMPSCAHGYIANISRLLQSRSIISNAEAHINRPFLLNLDLEGFFYSITEHKVREILEYFFEPIHPELMEILLRVLTLEGRLPTGSPASPVLSNMAALKLDIQLDTFCKEHHVTYTRYVDDLSFSAIHNVADQEEEITHIITSCGFSCQSDKRRFYGPKDPKVITGLVVQGEDVQPEPEFLNNLQRCIREYASMVRLNRQLEFDEKWMRKKSKHIEQSIKGQLNFLKQVSGKSDEYKKMKKAFNKINDGAVPHFDFYF